MVLAAGELVWVDFDPAFGHEQAGRRPALVISDEGYNDQSSFILICPITRNPRPWPFKLPLSNAVPIAGHVLVDQIKSVDKRRILTPMIGKADESLMSTVRGLLVTLLGIDAANR